MPAGNILIVAVDGLRAAALGAYGNTTFPTPALDRFAAESLLLDACFAASPDLHQVYRALWQSRHPLRPQPADGVGSLLRLQSNPIGEAYQSQKTPDPLPSWLAEHGYRTALVTDEPDVSTFADAAAFDACILVGREAARRAADIAHTAIARVFAAACDAVEEKEQTPRLVWLHSRGMYGPWDAPLELQETLLDEEDPPPREAIEPPDFALTGGENPDTAFRYSCAYAAQVMTLDACWEGLIETLAAHESGGRWLVMLIGTRGFPLGEHRRIGGVDPRLYADQLHVPWLVRFPDAKGGLARSGELVSHLDLLPTIMDLVHEGEFENSAATRFDGGSLVPLANGGGRVGFATGEHDKLQHPPVAKPTRPLLREALVFGSSAGRRAIRTPAWSLICNRTTDAGRASEKLDAGDCELYVRPDDRWEANDVADRCPEVAEGLARAMNDIADRVERGEPIPPEGLPEELLVPTC